ncbi:DUF6929 family protein [Cellvibrio sp. UBA7671]|uniref:DUF6929 family protein n=1 Tax=Cellvibrio sp. UBA7671 TaxID=1946312 RepID=UPI002F35C8F7
MILLSPIKTLTLSLPSHKDRHPHLSAASGLVQVGNWLYVVADDENHLGLFARDGDCHGELIPLFSGDLPLELEERKTAKPDLEVLTLIPVSKKYPNGALLALGSGSKEARHKGAIISFNDQGELGDAEIIDLALLYHELKEEIGKINIEGAVIIDKDIILFQRGNKKNKLNATIRFSLKQFYQYTLTKDKKSKHKLNAIIRPYDLGEIAGVPLCFTDATTLPDGTIIFTAAAENTSDAYLDGQCMGSIIGVINSQSDLHSIIAIDKIIKAEGVEAQLVNNKIHLLLVTDADDATLPAQVYAAELSGYPF